MAEAAGEVTDLQALRELFRTDMAEYDYCIGAERVEALFRKLLGEPEPEREPVTGTGAVNAQMIVDAWRAAVRQLPPIDTDSLLLRELLKK